MEPEKQKAFDPCAHPKIGGQEGQRLGIEARAKI
jgi:hypothetical protein